MDKNTKQQIDYIISIYASGELKRIHGYIDRSCNNTNNSLTDDIKRMSLRAGVKDKYIQ